MSHDNTSAIIKLAVPLCAVLFWIRARRNKPTLPLPPSPKSDPLIGHMRTLMGVTDEPSAYRDWGKDLGSDIISITLPPGNVIIILNSAEAANELLSRRSSIYSDRPQAPMASSQKLVGWGNNTGVIGYGERWRKQRRMTHEVLHRKASQDMWPVVVKESRLALQRILKCPSGFAKEVKRMAGSSLLSAVYGYEVTSSEDPLVEVVEAAVAGFCQAGIVSNFYVNVIPWLQYVPEWFPGAEWKRKANLWRGLTEQMLNTPYDWTKRKLATGNAPPSMLARLLSKHIGEESAEERDLLRWATGTLFAAGTDTSVASTLVFIMAMVMYPEVQTKAQAEIDAILGGVRLPEMTDRDSMPYMRSIVKEVFRWKTVVPLAIPHGCTQDDTYKGYRIPKGAAVIGNVWAMSNDEKVYPNPERFDPERFLDPAVPDAPAFGFGRRGCPGLHLAEASLFITACGLLTIFDILPARDEMGNPIQLKGEMGPNALVSQPLPFECNIKPRSERHERLLREWEA